MDTLTPTHTHENTQAHTQTLKGERGCGSTFNLPADLGEVGHPLEDFGVSCLVSMRGLWRAEEEEERENE